MFIVVLSQKATTYNILTDFNSYSRCRFIIECKDVSVFTSSPLISTCLLLPCHSLSSPRCCAVPKLPSNSDESEKKYAVEYIVSGTEGAGGQEEGFSVGFDLMSKEWSQLTVRI